MGSKRGGSAKKGLLLVGAAILGLFAYLFAVYHDALQIPARAIKVEGHSEATVYQTETQFEFNVTLEYLFNSVRNSITFQVEQSTLGLVTYGVDVQPKEGILSAKNVRPLKVEKGKGVRLMFFETPGRISPSTLGLVFQEFVLLGMSGFALYWLSLQCLEQIATGDSNGRVYFE